MSTPVADAKWVVNNSGRDKMNAAGVTTEREVHCFDGNLDVFTGTFYEAELGVEFDISTNGIGGSVPGSVGGGAIRLLRDLGEVATLQVKIDNGGSTPWTGVSIVIDDVVLFSGQTIADDAAFHSFALNDALPANAKIEIYSGSASCDFVYVKLV